MKAYKNKTELYIRKGDTVKVISGNSKHKTGKVLEVFPAKYRAIVEGVNVVSKHTKPSATNPNGGIVKSEASVHISNLMVVDPSSFEATRIGRKADDNGKLIRYAKKSGEAIKNG